MAGPQAEVTCTYTQENAWSRALEAESGSGSFDFMTSNGQILKLHNNPGSEFYSPVVGQFYGWVLTTHREGIDVLHVARPNHTRLTPESIALLGGIHQRVRSIRHGLKYALTLGTR